MYVVGISQEQFYKKTQNIQSATACYRLLGFTGLPAAACWFCKLLSIKKLCFRPTSHPNGDITSPVILLFFISPVFLLLDTYVFYRTEM